MKKLFIMMAGLLFAVSTAFASPSTQSDVVTMSKADSQALFGDSSVSVVALGNDEMEATEGEWVWNAFGALSGGYGAALGYVIGAGSDVTSHGLSSAFGAGAIAGALAPGVGFRSAWRSTYAAFAGGWFGGWY